MKENKKNCTDTKKKVRVALSLCVKWFIISFQTLVALADLSSWLLKLLETSFHFFALALEWRQTTRRSITFGRVRFCLFFYTHTIFGMSNIYVAKIFVSFSIQGCSKYSQLSTEWKSHITEHATVMKNCEYFKFMMIWLECQ